MVLAKKKTNRSTEQNKGPRNRLTQTVNCSLTKEQRQFNREKIVSSTNMLDQPTFASKKKKNLDIDLHLSQKLTQ